MGRDAHVDSLIQCFDAAMSMLGPFPALLGEGLERVLKEHPDPAAPPVMADLYRAVGQVLAEKGYSADLRSDLTAALEVRLGTLVRRTVGTTFRCGRSEPAVTTLLKGFTVLELDGLPTDVKCFLTLFLLTGICHELRVRGPWSAQVHDRPPAPPVSGKTRPGCPRQPMPAAAATGPGDDRCSREWGLLGDAVIVRCLPGLESGSLQILVTQRQFDDTGGRA